MSFKLKSVIFLFIINVFFVNTALFAKKQIVSLQFNIKENAYCKSDSSCLIWDTSFFQLRKSYYPVVPVKIVRIFVSAEEELADISIKIGAVKKMIYTPSFAQEQRPLCDVNIPLQVRDKYEGSPYPNQWMGIPQKLHFRGYTIVQIPIYPLRITEKDIASYINNAEILIETKKQTQLNSNFRGLSRDFYEAQQIVDTPKQYSSQFNDMGKPGYLILGPTKIVGNRSQQQLLDTFAKDKESRGFNVEIAYLEKVVPSLDPELIRKYIIKMYKENGIDYVLLVGDHKELPWQKIYSGQGEDYNDPVPSDQFYACLDGDFGEFSEAPYDWSCEVAVGRIGAKSQEDFFAWLDKTITLQKIIREGRTKDILNFGERLDGLTYGGPSLDSLINGSTSNPPSSGFPSYVHFSKLYDTEEKQYTGDDFISSINSGDFHVINHLGHAIDTHVFLLDDRDIPRIFSRPAFYYSQGCYPNNPDSDNWTIQAVRYPKYGPAAMIGNTRYGFYEIGTGGDGTSNRLHRMFWSMRFKNGVKSIGYMNHKAKELLMGINPEDPMMTYTTLESNLIGDPELDLGI